MHFQTIERLAKQLHCGPSRLWHHVVYKYHTDYYGLMEGTDTFMCVSLVGHNMYVKIVHGEGEPGDEARFSVILW